MEGEPLDIQRLLYTPAGKPRLSILSIAHLGDAERMFFVTILLNEVIAWMRGQSGTSSLRAVLYMDEVFGYFPPTANPPSKTPMLTLLKQARAFGLGVVLATQNPVDLDYKGLSERRHLVPGPAANRTRQGPRARRPGSALPPAAGPEFDRQKIEAVLSSLGNRVFLMNNVHEDQPVVFQTRWVLSYLRGPLTRDQIATLMQSRKHVASQPAAPVAAAPTAAVQGVPMAAATGGSRPLLPPGISESFLVSREQRPDGAAAVYRPALLGAAQIHFVQSSQGVDAWRDVTLLAPADSLGQGESVWERAQTLAEALELETEPAEGAAYTDLPGELSRPKTYTSLASDLKSHLYRTQRPDAAAMSAAQGDVAPDESEGDFRIRIRQAVVERRDLAVERLRAKYAPSSRHSSSSDTGPPSKWSKSALRPMRPRSRPRSRSARRSSAPCWAARGSAPRP